MRLVVLLVAGVLAVGVTSGCAGPGSLHGDGAAGPAPTVVPRTAEPSPAKTRGKKPGKSPGKRRSDAAGRPTVTPVPTSAVQLPSTEFDPDHYDPEGDHPPTAAPAPRRPAAPAPTPGPTPTPAPSPAPKPTPAR